MSSHGGKRSRDVPHQEPSNSQKKSKNNARLFEEFYSKLSTKNALTAARHLKDLQQKAHSRPAEEWTEEEFLEHHLLSCFCFMQFQEMLSRGCVYDTSNDPERFTRSALAALMFVHDRTQHMWMVKFKDKAQANPELFVFDVSKLNKAAILNRPQYFESAESMHRWNAAFLFISMFFYPDHIQNGYVFRCSFTNRLHGGQKLAEQALEELERAGIVDCPFCASALKEAGPHDHHNGEIFKSDLLVPPCGHACHLSCFCQYITSGDSPHSCVICRLEHQWPNALRTFLTLSFARWCAFKFFCRYEPLEDGADAPDAERVRRRKRSEKQMLTRNDRGLLNFLRLFDRFYFFCSIIPPSPEDRRMEMMVKLMQIVVQESPDSFHQYTDSFFSQLGDEVLDVMHEVAEIEREEERAQMEQELRDELRDELEEEIRDELRDEMDEEIDDGLSDDVDEEIRDELRELLTQEVRDELREELDEEVRDELRHDLEQQVRDQLYDDLREEVRAELRAELQQEGRGKKRQ